MPLKLSKILKDKPSASTVDPTIREYERRFGNAQRGGLEIVRFSGARIVGVNSNAYQLERARKLTEEAEMTHLAEFLHCEFLHVDTPDNSFDAVYAIEATCCAPDKLSIYGEVFRLLKPGGCFGAYEYYLTDRFDAQDPLHLKIKSDIEPGGGLQVQEGMRCKFATVLAIVTWSREKLEPEYQSGLLCDEWEVVVPEPVFEPEP